MALDLRQQEEYNRLLREGIELANKLGDSVSRTNFQSMPDSLSAGVQDLRQLTLQVGSLRREWSEFNIDVVESRLAFTRIVEELRNTQRGINLASNAFNGLASIAQRLSAIQNGISEASVRELRNLREKTLAKIEELRFTDKVLDKNKEELLAGRKRKDLSDEEKKKLDEIIRAQRQVNLELNFGEQSHMALLDQLNKEIEKQEQINKKLGLTGALIKGLSNIPILGNVIDTDKALDAARKAATEGASRFGVMRAALAPIGKDIKSFLTDPLTATLFILGNLWKTIISIDNQTGDLAKNFNLSYREASSLRGELNTIANQSSDLNVTTKGLQESLVAVGNSLSSNAQLNSKDLITMTKLRDQAGLTNEELVEMQKLTLATGGNLESNVSNLLFAAKTTALNNGVLLNEKQLMNEVSKASSATKLSLGGSAENLGKAVAQAKALGLNLEQVDKIAASLLEIETSISSELEAELLTGRELNLEQARLYALNNDIEGLSKEIAKNFGNAADFSKMNRIQQEAAAKALGMSREELARTLTDHEALVGLSGQQAEAAKQALADARARGMSEEEIKKKGIDGLMQQQSLQERLLATVEKLKEVFVTLVEPLMPLLDVLASVLGFVGNLVKLTGDWGKYIIAAVGAYKLLKMAQKSSLMMSIGEAAMGAIRSLSSIPILGWALGLAAAGTVAALGAKYMQGNDVISPGYGKRTLMGPEGAIALNDKDTVIAGTKLFGNDIKSEPGESTKMLEAGRINAVNQNKTTNTQTSTSSTTNIDIKPLLDELAAVKNILNQILSKEGAVYLDSTKVGTTLNVGTSKIQ